MSAHSHGHASGASGDRRVIWAIGVNLLLTIAQVVGGLVSGSLSLVADAIHNLSDAMALVIAFVARRIARKPADESMTWGYGRAEAVAALVNYTTLIVIGLYLVYEGVFRLFEPQPVGGWIVVAVAGLALAVDTATAVLTYALSKRSMNIRAAFLHNVSDALGSVGVIVAGTLIILYDWRIVDPIVTLMIAAYVLWQSFREIGKSIRLLMMGAPEDLDLRSLVADISAIDGVRAVYHIHAWTVTEETSAFEARVVISDDHSPKDVREQVHSVLEERHGITHVSLAIERGQGSRGEHPVVGHRQE